MNKKLIHTIYIVGGIIFVILLGLILWYSGFDYEGASHDEKTFKSSYESYNGKVNDDKEKYLTLKINKDNKIEYIDIDEAINKLSKGTSLIFMGSPTDHTTRAYIETIIDSVTSSKKIDKLYYLEVSYEEQNTYSKLVKAVGEDTLVLPRIDAIKDGKVIGVIENIELNENQNISDGLTKEQKDVLKNAMNVLIEDINTNNNVCTDDC